MIKILIILKQRGGVAGTETGHDHFYITYDEVIAMEVGSEFKAWLCNNDCVSNAEYEPGSSSDEMIGFVVEKLGLSH